MSAPDISTLDSGLESDEHRCGVMSPTLSEHRGKQLGSVSLVIVLAGALHLSISPPTPTLFPLPSHTIQFYLLLKAGGCHHVNEKIG